MTYKLLITIFIISILGCKDINKVSTSSHEKSKSDTFKNPLLSSGADPWVIQKEGMYYYTHTSGNRLEIRTTERMEHIKDATPVTIWKPPAGKSYSQQIWAPELHHLDGKWYMYFAATFNSGKENSLNENRRMFVLENSSASPLDDNWKYKGKITDQTDRWAIDGTVLEYKGKRYFIWSGWRGVDHATNTGRQQLYIARMVNPWTLEGNRVMISEPEYNWEKNGLVNEGPVILKNKHNKTFLIYSGSGCWTDDYKLGMLVLKDNGDPLKPGDWMKHSEPVFEKKPGHQAFGPGHNSFFKSPNGKEDWILYHANPGSGDGCGGKRSPRMQKIIWDNKGFPILGEPADLNVELEVPSGGKNG